MRRPVGTMVKKSKKPETKPGSRAVINPENKFIVWPLAAALFLLAFATYYPVLSHPFHSWDDQMYITANSRVLNGLDPGNVKWAFSTTYFGFYYPLTWLSHMADVQLFGLDPRGHYFTSVVIHGINAALLFALFLLCTGSRMKAAAASALFAVHPMNVESVAWLAERKNLQSAFFLLLALIFYVLKHRGGEIGGIRRWYPALYYAFFIMGLLTKPSVVVFPLLLLLLDFWPLKRIPPRFAGMKEMMRSLRGPVVEKIPLFLLSLASGILTIVAQRDLGAMNFMSGVPFHQKIGEALLGYGFYIRKLFFPVNLSALYVHHRGDYHLYVPALILAGLAAATILFFKMRDKSPVLIAGWMFFLVSLLPVIGIIQVGAQAYADRYAYFPYWGLFAAVIFGIPWEKPARRRTAVKAAVACLYVVVAGFFLVSSRAQIATWKDDKALFSNIIGKSPDALMAYFQLAGIYDKEGDPEKAGALYDKALEICESDLAKDPKSPAALYNKANILFNRKKYEESLENFQLALKNGYPEKESIEKIKITKAMILNNILSQGKSAMELGSWNEAEAGFRKAASLSPDTAEIWGYLAYVLERKGLPDEAESAYEKALELNPGLDAETFNLALLKLNKGRFDEARGLLASLVRLKSPYAERLREILPPPAGSRQ